MSTPNATQAQIQAILGDLNEADAKILKAFMEGKGKSRRNDEVTLMAKYPHMVEGSLRFNETAQKQEVDITCSEPGCSEGRTVFTSDLFQISRCPEHAKAQAKAKREAKAAHIKELLAKAALK